MECPYCNKELKLGTLCARGGSGLYWLPEGEKLKLSVSNKIISNHNGIVFVDCNEIGSVRQSAYICPECRKLIFNY